MKRERETHEKGVGYEVLGAGTLLKPKTQNPKPIITLSKLTRVSLNLLRLGLRKSNPFCMNVLIHDRLGVLGKVESSRKHLDAAIDWICRAQDVCGGEGVSAGYSFIESWQSPYPETTGYIIPTFYDYAELINTGARRDEIRDRARRMADWEIEVQLPSGAVQGSHFLTFDSDRYPVVFNTGQVILGWCRAYVETRGERYLQAAKRAGDWLISVQSPNGSWQLDGPVVETSVHAYDARTAWSLLEIAALIKDEKEAERYIQAAQLNLEWTLAQQQENGWFINNSFSLDRHPPTHSISYVIEGLLEAERLTGESRYLNAALKTANTLLTIFESLGFMPGDFNSAWDSTDSYSCLTGNAQVAGVWLRIYQKTGGKRYLNGALTLNNFVKSTQKLTSFHPGVRGGVKGSQPINGPYMQYTYPNWAAKFLADSLILEERIRLTDEENGK